MSGFDPSGLIVIFACLGAGLVLRRSGRLPLGAHRALNAFAAQVSLPALVLVRMHALLRDPAVLSGAWVPVSMAWLQFALACGFSFLVGRAMRLSRPSLGALILTAGLGNTSFVGFPLLEAFFGKESLAIGVLADQPGSFLVFSTAGVVTASLLSGSGTGLGQVLRRTLSFPPMIAFLLAAALSPLRLPSALVSALETLSLSLVPVALVSVGAQLGIDRAALRRRFPALASGLLFKLVLAPSAMAAIYVVWAGQRGLVAQVTVVEAAMAPMITGAILVEEAGLDTELSGLMVGLGIPLSLLTVPAWAALSRLWA